MLFNILSYVLLLNNGKTMNCSLLSICFLFSVLVRGSHHEEQLFRDLFQNYNPLIRPVRNVDQTITVSFSIALLQLISVVEKEQVLKTNVWLQVVSRERQEEGKPFSFGLEMARLSIEMETRKIRRNSVDSSSAQSSLDAGRSFCFSFGRKRKIGFSSFQLVLFNNADGKYEASFKSHVVVYYNGDMNWIPPAIYKSSCFIDVKFFPFGLNERTNKRKGETRNRTISDQQTCELRFGSWTYNQNQLNFTYYDENERRVTVKDYVVSGSWDLMDGPMSIQQAQNESFDSMKNSYRRDRVEFVCKLVIRRKTLFYTVNLIIPTVGEIFDETKFDANNFSI